MTEPQVLLARAARTAGYAPSIHNTQPWRWRVTGSTLDLYAQRDRQLPVTDPLSRLLTLSCGAALHHVRLAIAAEGWHTDVHRLPDPHDATWLATITLTDRAAPDPRVTRLEQAITIRHTDRRPVPDIDIDPAVLAQLRDICEAENARLHLLKRDDVITLASAAAQAQSLEAMDPAWRDELTYWIGAEAPAGAGIPTETIPERAPETTVPGRDFGQTGALPVSSGHDRYATYAILYTDTDEPIDWLRGGEALSAMWLTATEAALTLVPLSAAVEIPATRQTLRGLLSNLGEPLLVLRLGVGDPEHAGPPHTPRLPADQVVEIATT
jgi:nitroreductase